MHLSHWLSSFLSIIIMIGRVVSLFRFCSQVVGTGSNSINPVGKFIAYGHYFPVDWTQEFIYSQLDPSKRAITQLQLVRNRLGKATGKVLLKFATEEDMRHCIEKYNEDFIVTKEDAHRVIIKPFQLKTIAKRDLNQKRKTKHAVKVKNLDFDINEAQLRKLGKDFGTVEFIEMQIRPNGMNNGLATIYFKKAKEAEDFSYFCHDLVLRERKLTAEVTNFKNKESSQISYLEEPKITIEANERLYKRMLAEEVRLKQERDNK